MRQQAQREREAAAAINNLGGEVSWSRPPYWTFDGGLFGHVYQVNMDGEHHRRATDTWLEHLKGFNKLEIVDLDGAQITDDGLQHLSELNQLQELDLDRTQVTDAGLQRLKGLKRLKMLHLVHTRVTDEGVEQLQKALPSCNIIRTWW